MGTNKRNIREEYSIRETLGQGAYGKVVKVIHRRTSIIRAMKSIKKQNVIMDDENSLFTEINILKNLNHPNVINIYELFQDQKYYHIITEFCSGGELFDRIKEARFFSEKMAANYMKQILSAVVYCHERNIVHR